MTSTIRTRCLIYTQCRGTILSFEFGYQSKSAFLRSGLKFWFSVPALLYYWRPGNSRFARPLRRSSLQWSSQVSVNKSHILVRCLVFQCLPVPCEKHLTLQYSVIISQFAVGGGVEGSYWMEVQEPAGIQESVGNKDTWFVFPNEVVVPDWKKNTQAEILWRTSNSPNQICWRSSFNWIFNAVVSVVIFGAIAVGMAFMGDAIGSHVLQVCQLPSNYSWHCFFSVVISNDSPTHKFLSNPQASNSFVSGTAGPLLGVFVLGAFFPFANWKVGTNCFSIKKQFLLVGKVIRIRFLTDFRCCRERLWVPGEVWLLQRSPLLVLMWRNPMWPTRTQPFPTAPILKR